MRRSFQGQRLAQDTRRKELKSMREVLDRLTPPTGFSMPKIEDPERLVDVLAPDLAAEDRAQVVAFLRQPVKTEAEGHRRLDLLVALLEGHFGGDGEDDHRPAGFVQADPPKTKTKREQIGFAPPHEG